MTPVLVIPGIDYVVCFNPGEEFVGMRKHFMEECGWTEEQFEGIEDFAWFNAEVSLWQGGAEIDCQHLGCCCYGKPSEFYTRFAADYFSDMVRELVEDHCPQHVEWAKAWQAQLREKATLREVQA